MNNKYYYYKYHGLVLKTKVFFPELPVLEKVPLIDIKINYKFVPKSIDDENVVKNPNMGTEITSNKFLLTVFNKVRFLALNGKEIRIYAYGGTPESIIRHYILGAVINACLHQRSLLPLHASAIVANGFGVAFGGESGIGKSTTATALALKGYNLLSDDTTVVRFKNQFPIISASYPRVKLWEDSLKEIGKKQLDNLQLLKGYTLPEKNMSKYGITMQNTYFSGTVPLKILYHLVENKDSPNEFEVNQKSIIEGGFTISQCIAKREYLKGMRANEIFFYQCISISKKIIIKEIKRPIDGFQINDLIKILEKDFLSICI